MDLNVDLTDKSENSNIVPYISPLRRILLEVAGKHGLSENEIISKAPRYYPSIAARNEFFYRACVETQESFSKIGHFVNVDHTSVHYGADRYALFHDLPPPRDKPLAKAARARKKSYPKSLSEVSRVRLWARENLDVRYHEDIRGLAALRRRAQKGSIQLLELLRKHHGPLVG